MAVKLLLTPTSLFLTLALCLICAPNAAAQGERLRLQVHESGRYLVDANGAPFFWLGDTAWALFTELTEEEVAEYLDDRHEKGFTVVQAVLAWGGGPAPNAYDEAPWIDGDPAAPNPAYFDRAARIVEMAAEREIVMALLPAWGDFVTVNQRINAGNAYEYGNWLGARLGEYPNIVWVLGGDRLPDGHEDVFRRLAAGIAEAEDPPHLMTYHPRGGGHSSSEFFHADSWLGLNMIQSGHAIDYPDYKYVLRDYELFPARPTLVGEPRYENITHGLRGEGPRVDDHDVRKAAWQSVLSGACGHTYGCNGIFQFWRPDMQSRWNPGIQWRDALDLPGARHMGVLKAIMTSVDWWRLQPAQEMVAGGGQDGYYVAAARSAHGDFALVYFPEYMLASVDLSRIGGEGVRAEWINPRTGEHSEIGRFDQKAGRQDFLPPTGDEDPDWLLMLGSAVPDTTPPRIVSVSAGGDPERVRVRFSEPLDPTTAQNAANYAVEPQVTVAGAELVGDAVVVLATSPMTEQEYTLTVSGVADRWVTPNVIAAGTTATFPWTAEPPRVRDGLVALYTFAGVQDGVISDDSDVEQPLPLAIEEGSGADAVEGELVVGQTSLIASRRPATELAQACMATNEITIEAWVRPANLDQEGPARIVTLSRDTGERNFTLGQEHDRYIVRLRTTETGPNGTPPLEAPEGSLTTELAHVVYTRADDGTARLYIDGEEVATLQVGGDLSSWSEDYRLGLANELTRDRTWLGSISLVAVYSRALGPEEVALNFQAGPDAGA